MEKVENSQQPVCIYYPSYDEGTSIRNLISIFQKRLYSTILIFLTPILLGFYYFYATPKEYTSSFIFKLETTVLEATNDSFYNPNEKNTRDLLASIFNDKRKLEEIYHLINQNNELKFNFDSLDFNLRELSGKRLEVLISGEVDYSELRKFTKSFIEVLPDYSAKELENTRKTVLNEILKVTNSSIEATNFSFRKKLANDIETLDVIIKQSSTSGYSPKAASGLQDLNEQFDKNAPTSVLLLSLSKQPIERLQELKKSFQTLLQRDIYPFKNDALISLIKKKNQLEGFLSNDRHIKFLIYPSNSIEYNIFRSKPLTTVVFLISIVTSFFLVFLYLFSIKIKENYKITNIS